jgi:hypothetical protein
VAGRRVRRGIDPTVVGIARAPRGRYVVFDLLYLRGRSLLGEPLASGPLEGSSLWSGPVRAFDLDREPKALREKVSQNQKGARTNRGARRSLVA